MEKEIMQFVGLFNHISISDLDDILEHLEDKGYLSKEGKKFAKELWKTFIKS